MSSYVYFNFASWFPGYVPVKPHFNTQWGGERSLWSPDRVRQHCYYLLMYVRTKYVIRCRQKFLYSKTFPLNIQGQNLLTFNFLFTFVFLQNRCKYYMHCLCQNLITCAHLKVHIFWEGYKILRNLHPTFVYSTYRQKYGGDFAKILWLSLNTVRAPL